MSDRDQDQAALYCSTTEIAFGPIFHDNGEYDAMMRASSFLRWLGARDARQFTEVQLLDLHSKWLAQEKDQWKREEEADDLI